MTSTDIFSQIRHYQWEKNYLIFLKHISDIEICLLASGILIWYSKRFGRSVTADPCPDKLWVYMLAFFPSLPDIEFDKNKCLHTSTIELLTVVSSLIGCCRESYKVGPHGAQDLILQWDWRMQIIPLYPRTTFNLHKQSCCSLNKMGGGRFSTSNRQTFTRCATELSYFDILCVVWNRAICREIYYSQQGLFLIK